MIRIAGLDLSLTATGVALVGGETALIRPGAKIRGPERLDRIEQDVLNAVRDAHLVVIEGYSMSSHTAHSHALGELGGVIRLALWRAGMPHVDVPPASLKLYATGRGNATKELVLVEAVKRLGYTGSDTNEADALWLRALARDAYGVPVVAVPGTHRRAISAVAWPGLPGLPGAAR